MIGIVVFLGLIGIAAGIAVWRSRHRPWRDVVPERLEPRFPFGSI